MSDSNKLEEYGADILKGEKFQGMRKFIHHGTVSVLEHSLRVATVSMKIGEFLMKAGFNIRMRELVRGAMLHDYFLYDWHVPEKWHRLHGFSHAETALRNASKDFNLTYNEREIIRTHMFPLNITKIPTVMEAWIVTMADKYCSLVETVTMRGKDRTP